MSRAFWGFEVIGKVSLSLRQFKTPDFLIEDQGFFHFRDKTKAEFRPFCPLLLLSNPSISETCAVPLYIAPTLLWVSQA